MSKQAVDSGNSACFDINCSNRNDRCEFDRSFGGEKMANKKQGKSSATAPKELKSAVQPVSATLGKRSMPWFGWAGLGILILSEILLYMRNHPVEYAFTAIMWTGYILLLDGWIWTRGGSSYFKDQKREWPMLALLSILIWVMFEVYNFKLKNWNYVGLPDNMAIKLFLYFWAFATIIPA